MRKLKVFESVSLDGYFSGPEGDMSWAYAQSEDPAFQKFVQGNAGTPAVLLFGRKTYDMMAGYWPSPQAALNAPEVAKGMNAAEKMVFSRKMKKAEWAHTTLICSGLVEAVRKLKQEPGKDLVILGSGSIVTQVAEAGLVDLYQLVIKPTALGEGNSLFAGMETPLALKLVNSRTFADGNVVLDYVPHNASSR